jgi:penicillin-binding protein 1A
VDSPSAPRDPASPAAARSLTNPQPPRRSWLRWIAPPLVAAIAGSGLGVAIATAIHVPRVESLDEFKPHLITQFLDRDGQSFASYARERRLMLEENEIPALLQNAIVAAEDAEFWRHGGIDAIGIVRSVLVNLERGRKAQGASTITMQLARKLFLTNEKTWKRKLEEALVAVDLEKTLSKQQILTLYCNLAFLGHGNYGMEAASRYYFGHGVHDLKLPEAAMLAGVLQRPGDYSPYRNPQKVVARRNYVLQRMREESYITPAEYSAAAGAPLELARHRQTTEVGSYFAEEVRQELERRYGPDRLYEEGFRVETTLDGRIQRSAEKSLRQGLLALDHRKGWRGPIRRGQRLDLSLDEIDELAGRNPIPDSWVAGLVLRVDPERAEVRSADGDFVIERAGIKWTGREAVKDVLRQGDLAWFRQETPEKEGAKPYWMVEQEPVLEGAAIVLESGTGAVRGLVGGWDFRRNKFDRATQAARQVGSAFKAFVYGAAIENGFTPADTLFDAPAAFLGADGLPSYSPRNYYRKYYGIITLRRALEQSVNVTAVKLLDLVGVSKVIDFARRCGVRSELPPYPSLALGSADLVPMEVAAAYASFANQGVWVEPYFVESVRERSGSVVDHHQVQATKAIDANVAYVLTHMLEGVVDEGTAQKISDLPLDIAGKTGTTNDYTDAWFIGFTPRYTMLVWVGYDQKKTIGKKMTGAEAALPAWRLLAEAGLKDGWLREGETFSVPPGVELRPIEYWSGLAAAPGAERTVQEAFLPGSAPDKAWESRWQSILALPWAQQRAFYTPKARERMPETYIGALIQQAGDDNPGD